MLLGSMRGGKDKREEGGKEGCTQGVWEPRSHESSKTGEGKTVV